MTVPDAYWCPLCGGDFRSPDHEDACRLKLSQLRPSGIIVDEDDRTDALVHAFRSAGAHQRVAFFVDDIYTAASSHARYGPDDEQYLEVWHEELARYRGESHEQFYIRQADAERDARIILERQWTLDSRPRRDVWNHDWERPLGKPSWVTNLMNPPIDVEGREHGDTSTEVRQVAGDGDQPARERSAHRELRGPARGEGQRGDGPG